MGVAVLLLGQSGTGKSASMRNLTSDKVLVINVADKPLPFKNKFESITPSYENTYRDIINAMDNTKKKVIVIDDAQYIMSFQYMRRIKENGWDKWNDIQGDFFNIINHVKKLPSDVIVYFMSHLERNDDGYEKVKTMGKMLDEKITIEGLFSIVLKTNVSDGTYSFVTQNSGRDTVKSPIGMFPSYAIDNDLAYVDEKIRNYYEIGEFISDEEMVEIDKVAEKVDVIKPEPTSSRRSSRRKTSEAKMNISDGLGETKIYEPEPEQEPLETAPVDQPQMTERKQRKQRHTEPEEPQVDETPTETPKVRTRRRKATTQAE